jgi:hypothetical protein
MSQEIKYEEDFTGADGSLPAEWRKIDLGADIGIQGNVLELDSSTSYNGDGLAIQDDAGGYLFSKEADWDLRFDLSITGLDNDFKKIELMLSTGGSEKIGFVFKRSGALRILAVRQGSGEPVPEITIPALPTKIRYRNISGTLFLDYDIGSGYEFGGGPAYSSIIMGSGLYYFFADLQAASSTTEFRVTVDNYVVLGDVIILSDFWHNHTLQTVQENAHPGSLEKLSTVKIIKSTGQPYVPPTEATEPKSSSSSGVNYVCERVV